MNETPNDRELDDIREQASITGYLTPREYARIRGTSPQLIYYHIRNGTIDLEFCKCGRRVLNVELADKALQEKARQQGKQLDTRDDSDRTRQGPMV